MWPPNVESWIRQCVVHYDAVIMQGRMSVESVCTVCVHVFCRRMPRSFYRAANVMTC